MQLTQPGVVAVQRHPSDGVNIQTLPKECRGRSREIRNRQRSGLMLVKDEEHRLDAGCSMTAEPRSV